jgi:peptidyl serine alpha-galactosyltransferase
LPKDFLSCETPLLKEPPATLATDYDYYIQPTGENRALDPKMAKRSAFFVCYMTRIVNRAASYWKSQHCDSLGQTANLEKTMMLVDVK